MARRSLRLFVPLVATAATALACSDGVAPERFHPQTTVHVSASNVMLDDGGTTPLAAEVRGPDGGVLPNVPVTWSTTNADAVTVNATTGVATAVAHGSAWVVASDGEARDSVQVMVGYTKISGPQPFVSVSMYIQAFNSGGCARTAAGAAYCWGTNQYGELGNGSTTPSLTTPVAVSGGLLFEDVQAGYQAACGLTQADGAIYCWGHNDLAQFGTGSAEPQQSNVPLLGPATLRFSAFSMSPDGTNCALATTDALVYCWGNDIYWTTGHASDHPIAADSVVAPVDGNLHASQVDVSDTHGCAVLVDHTTWCWGNGSAYGAATNSRVPVQVAPAGTLASVTSGEWSTCGLTSAGQALCWGSGLTAGAASSSGTVTTPTPVAGALRFKKLTSSFWDFACGLTLDGDVYCWGENEYADFTGMLGRAGGSAMASAPVPVLPGRKFVDIDDWCGVDVAGDIYCWGQRP